MVFLSVVVHKLLELAREEDSETAASAGLMTGIVQGGGFFEPEDERLRQAQSGGRSMYRIRTEQYFDAAHFLAGYEGKCSNLHGHRWRVVAEILAEELQTEGPLRGMVTDFGELRRELLELTERFDHRMIYEEGTLREKTILALREEGFSLVCVPFRPTAELFARYFYEALAERGCRMASVTVYETPCNCAVYSAEDV